MDPESAPLPFRRGDGQYSLVQADDSIDLLEPSPVVDLVALSTARGDLVCVRSWEWARIWSQSCPYRPRSMAWRPDGKLLAVGFENGAIQLRDSETGEVKFTCASSKQPIVGLCWAEDCLAPQQSVWGNVAYREFSGFLPPLPTLPNCESIVGDIFVSDTAAALNLLVSIDDGGQIQVRAFGVYTVAELMLPPEGSDNAQDCRLYVTPDLAHIVVSSQQADAFSLAIYSGAMLRPKAADLQFVSRCWITFKYLLSYIEEVMIKMKAEAKAVYRLELQQHDKFADLLEECEISSTPQMEYMNLLEFGIVGDGIKQFVDRMGLPGIRRWKQAAEVAYTNFGNLAQKHLVPVCERIFTLATRLQVFDKRESTVVEFWEDSNFKETNNIIELSSRLMVLATKCLFRAKKRHLEFKDFIFWINSFLHIKLRDETADMHVDDKEPPLFDKEIDGVCAHVNDQCSLVILDAFDASAYPSDTQDGSSGLGDSFPAILKGLSAALDRFFSGKNNMLTASMGRVFERQLAHNSNQTNSSGCRTSGIRFRESLTSRSISWSTAVFDGPAFHVGKLGVGASLSATSCLVQVDPASCTTDVSHKILDWDFWDDHTIVALIGEEAAQAKDEASAKGRTMMASLRIEPESLADGLPKVLALDRVRELDDDATSLRIQASKNTLYLVQSERRTIAAYSLDEDE
ncbi:anaphase-promoting complex, cyclosome, subunit 4-domain-containing protein [Polychytrium aggregatum]|uniref:anaphase-promoting complex, cyclosome, subunit 4-domain-containing protein n=1 Tax=Polychytrium aggregatum TaxID=110093 RepID=UPI0022FDC41E|nr:anaphase-promoting complex, cyclosome, subunit 4-domain-containing protein [Polychytrium aggregatum]KAI9203765.1 anaphase-promoting complex, cyclosome, subunit 4-domain-containing protein [Polychytrium aggregatum]